MSYTDAALLVPLLVVVLAWSGVALALLATRLRVPRLPELPAEPPAGAPWPSLSVIVPARDEERDVEAAVRSLLAQDYAELDVVAVDDRSRDATGAILDRLAAADPRLEVVHVRELPAGWLGKNHACHLGAGRSRGEWLLFTDGDVHFAPDALRRAVAFALRARLGHVVALPHLIAPGFWERAFQSAFGLFVSLKFQAWALHRPRSRAFIGIGAFNLVRRDAYDGVGGHARLALEVIDDAKLGLILRRSGVAQGAADSGGLVRVHWNWGLLGSMRGLLKNAFAATEFRWRGMAIAVGVLGLMTALPPAALLLGGSGAVRALALGSLLLPMLIHGALARHMAGGTGLEGLAFPPCGLALAGVALASALSATLCAGIVWRGTHYPLAALRAGCVREGDWPSGAAVGWE